MPSNHPWLSELESKGTIVDHHCRLELSLFSDLLSLANLFVDSERKKYHSPREATVQLLFFRLLESCQASVALCRYRLEVEAEVVARSTFEFLLELVLCSKERDYAGKYLDRAPESGLRLVRGALETKHVEFSDREDFWREQERRLRSLTETRARDRIEQKAQDAGFGDLYQVFYRLASLSTHADPLSLVRHIKEHQGIIRELVTSPSIDKGAPGRIIDLVSRLLVIGIETYLSVFGVEQHDGLEKIKDRLRAQGD